MCGTAGTESGGWSSGRLGPVEVRTGFVIYRLMAGLISAEFTSNFAIVTVGTV